MTVIGNMLDATGVRGSACECFHEKVEMLHDKLLKYFFQNVIYLFCFFFCLPNKQLLGVSETCSKLTIKTPERLWWHRSGVFVVNFENLSYLLRSVSIVNIEQVVACNSESYATLTKILARVYRTGTDYCRFGKNWNGSISYEMGGKWRK